MKYIIFPNDSSIDFMSGIFDKAEELMLGQYFELIRCPALDSGYEDALTKIKAIPKNSTVIFIGHSTPEVLYGGHSDSFARKPLVSLKNMSIFKDVNLVLISCFSNKLIKSSRSFRNYSSCIGFGLLPSELGEADNHSGMKDLKLESHDIDKFNGILSSIISDAICQMLRIDMDMYSLFRYVKILINKKANDLVLTDKDTKLSDLLFYVSRELLIE